MNLQAIFVTFVLSTVSFSFAGCNTSLFQRPELPNSANQSSEPPKPVKQENDANFAVIDFDSSGHKYIYENVKQTELVKTEIKTVQILIKKAVNDFNKNNHHPSPDYKLKDLSVYKFQFIPVINEKNEKEVYVNAFCSSFELDWPDWKKQLIEVNDGGNCFFHFYMNLTKNSYTDVSVNGEA